MSKFIPNSYQTPNVLVDEIMPFLTPQEWVVLSYAVRHILGWQDTIESRKNCISISRFENCGLARSTILTALNQLVAFKLLEPIGEPTNKGQMWRLTFDDEPDIDGLIDRKQDRAIANGIRTKKARDVLSDRAVSGTEHQRSVGQNGTGLSDRHNKTQYSNTLSNTYPANAETPALKSKSIKQTYLDRANANKLTKADLVIKALAIHLFKASDNPASIDTKEGRIKPLLFGCSVGDTQWVGLFNYEQQYCPESPHIYQHLCDLIPGYVTYCLKNCDKIVVSQKLFGDWWDRYRQATTVQHVEMVDHPNQELYKGIKVTRAQADAYLKEN